MAIDIEDDLLALPLVQEVATVTKETVETGRVRVSTRVEQHRELIQEALKHDDVVVERVPVGTVVEVAPEIRVEGNVLVYPIMEEVLVVEKRLVLKEELRISRKVHTETVDREVTLRRVHADVERTPAQRS